MSEQPAPGEDPNAPAVTYLQRIAAYVLLVDSGRVLLAQLAPTQYVSAAWTLPGGGVDHGEDPTAAAVREVYEETGMTIDLGSLLGVMSVHRVTVEPDGSHQDYHSVGIVYSGTAHDPTQEPRVTEVDGSTMDCGWVSIDSVVRGDLTISPRVIKALIWAGHVPPDTPHPATVAKSQPPWTA